MHATPNLEELPAWEYLRMTETFKQSYRNVLSTSRIGQLEKRQKLRLSTGGAQDSRRSETFTKHLGMLAHHFSFSDHNEPRLCGN